MTEDEMNAIITDQVLGPILQAVLDEYKVELGETPSVAKVKGLSQAQAWRKLAQESEEWPEDDDGNTMETISGLPNDNLLAFWKLLVAHGKLLAKSGKKAKGGKAAASAGSKRSRAQEVSDDEDDQLGIMSGGRGGDGEPDEEDEEDDDGLFVKENTTNRRSSRATGGVKRRKIARGSSEGAEDEEMAEGS